MKMLNELIKSKVEIPLFRLENLVEIETKYNQLFEKLFDENECNELLKIIDIEKFNALIEEYNDDEENE